MIATVERTCEICGTDISHRNTRARYCSESCRVSQYRPPKPARTWTCVDCGATGTQTGKGRNRQRCRDCLTAPPTVHIRNCQGCGDMFATTRTRQRHCRKGCDRKTTLTCEWCGEEFIGTKPRGDRTGKAYCSQECLGADRQAHAEPVPWRTCPTCDVSYIRRGWSKCPTCNPEPLGPHRSISDQPRTGFVFVAGNCQECTAPFVGLTTTLTHAPIHCSMTCSRRVRNRERGGKGTNSRARRIVRVTGARYEPLNRTRILERDDYVCHLCGVDTDPDAPVCSDRYPSLDHVIPLSKGGDHTYDNVRCACFSCNWQKSDQVGSEFSWGGHSDAFGSTPRPHAEKFLFRMGGSG